MSPSALLALNAVCTGASRSADEAEQEGSISAILLVMAEFITYAHRLNHPLDPVHCEARPMFAGMLEKRENTICEA